MNLTRGGDFRWPPAGTTNWPLTQREEHLAQEVQEQRAQLAGRAQADGAACGASAESPRSGDAAVDAARTDAPRVTQNAEQAACSAEARRRNRTDLGEALLHLARTGLEALGQQHPEAARRSRSRLTAQVDPITGWGRLRDGEVLPPSSLRNLASTLPGAQQLRRLTLSDLSSRDLGRSARHPNVALREFLGTLDGERCRFPGCTRTHRLHAHHVRYWEDGGPTDLANLVLVCSRHHTLIHTMGFQLLLKPDRSLIVRTSDGTRLLHHPAQPWQPADDLDPDVAITATTLRSGRGDQRVDLGYAVAVLSWQAA